MLLHETTRGMSNTLFDGVNPCVELAVVPPTSQASPKPAFRCHWGKKFVSYECTSGFRVAKCWTSSVDPKRPSAIPSIHTERMLATSCGVSYVAAWDHGSFCLLHASDAGIRICFGQHHPTNLFRWHWQAALLLAPRRWQQGHVVVSWTPPRHPFQVGASPVEPVQDPVSIEVRPRFNRGLNPNTFGSVWDVSRDERVVVDVQRTARDASRGCCAWKSRDGSATRGEGCACDV